VKTKVTGKQLQEYVAEIFRRMLRQNERGRVGAAVPVKAVENPLGAEYGPAVEIDGFVTLYKSESGWSVDEARTTQATREQPEDVDVVGIGAYDRLDEAIRSAAIRVTENNLNCILCSMGEEQAAGAAKWPA